MAKAKGPHFVRYFGPVLDALRQLGGSGKPGEVVDAVAQLLQVPESQQEETLPSGEPRFKNQVAWARFYLAKGGYIDASERGVWALTAQGQDATFNHEQAVAVFKNVHKEFLAQKKQGSEATDDASPEEAEEQIDHRAALLGLLQSLPPDGFEKICQRLLREAGFTQVVVTGKSGDGGIDGHGILEINPFVTFTVLFQCKRYTKNPVTSGQVRDFRGAMLGRADKGIIITTGYFTPDARKEARRDGAPPLELVDSEKLIDMFEALRLGLTERTTFDVDNKFFDAFR